MRCASCGAQLLAGVYRIDFGDGQDPFPACSSCATTARHCGLSITRHDEDDDNGGDT